MSRFTSIAVALIYLSLSVQSYNIIQGKHKGHLQTLQQMLLLQDMKQRNRGYCHKNLKLQTYNIVNLL